MLGFLLGSPILSLLAFYYGIKLFKFVVKRVVRFLIFAYLIVYFIVYAIGYLQQFISN